MKKTHSKSPSHISISGERSAFSGYWPQYVEFGIRTYEALIAGNLEEVRVADWEDNVGKLDDVCYVTKDAVYAYQVKWSNVGASFTYLDFKAVLPGIVDGWKKLKQLYPDKHVYAHLLTNRVCSKRDRGMKDGTGKVLGSFSEFDSSVLPLLAAGKRVPSRWTLVAKELRALTSLRGAEWSSFWNSFSFKHSYAQEAVSVEKAIAVKKTEDIKKLMLLYAQEAAGKKDIICLKAEEISRRLGWDYRQSTIYNHNLTVPKEEFEPNKRAIASLKQVLSGLNKGYILLKGTPGSGKSTVLTQWCDSLPNKSVRYYAFDFRNPSSKENNDPDRGNRTTFFFDMCHLLKDVGFDGGSDTLIYKDYHFLKSLFYAQLRQASSYYQTSGLPLIVIVDGLDHITREYTSCAVNLLEGLPDVSEIPDGVVFVLGSQHYSFKSSMASIVRWAEKGKTIIDMPPLSKEEVESLLVKRLGSSDVTSELVNKCLDKSQGHPLYLGYIINQLKVKGIDAIDSVDGFTDDIEDYYRRMLVCDSDNSGGELSSELMDCLGLLCRVPGKVPLEYLESWGISSSQKLQLRKLKHLFVLSDNTLSFFHNSFRQYLIQQTAIDAFTEKFSEKNDHSFYERLYEFSTTCDAWESGYYLYHAGKYDEFIAKLSPEELYSQMQDFRPQWSVLQDLKYGVEIAKERRDPYLLARYALFREQLHQMSWQDYSVLSLVDVFLEMGNVSLATGLILRNSSLRCRPSYALRLVCTFYKAGYKDTAKELFNLSYPSFMSKRLNKQEKNRNRAGYDIDDWTGIVLNWARAAACFYPWRDVNEYIQQFVRQIKLFEGFYKTPYKEKFDWKDYQSSIIKEFAAGLVEVKNWSGLEGFVLENLSAKKDARLAFHVWIEAILALQDERGTENNGGDEDLISRYYTYMTSTFNRFKEKERPWLSMANMSRRLGQPVPVITDYLSHVTWDSLGSFYLNSQQGLSALDAHCCYVRLRSYLGQDDDVEKLVPEDHRHEDNSLMVKYARRLFSLAKFAGQAQAGKLNTSVTFLSEVKGALEFFDNLPHMGSNLFSYTIQTHRKDFYEYLAEVAAMYGDDTRDKFAALFQDYCSSRYCQANPESVRQVILTLYESGYNPEQCLTMLADLEPNMMKNQNVDGQIRQAYTQGQAWIKLNENGRALACFHKMIEGSFGVGNRKDYQPSTFAMWIGAAIKNNTSSAEERIHWLTSRLKYLVSSTESHRIAYNASRELLTQVLNYNISSGIHLAQWMLDEEWLTFQTVTKILITCFLEKASLADYPHILNLYSRIYLFTMDDMSSDVDDTLLRKIINRGTELGWDRTMLEKQLQNAINTQCPCKISAILLKCLSNLDTPSEKLKNDYYELLPDQKYLDEASALFECGQKKEAWEKAEKALALSSDYGWAGGTRLKACMMLSKIDFPRARDIVFESVSQEIEQGNTVGMRDYLEEIVAMLSDNIDRERLFSEEFAYMNRILRPDTECVTDKPDVTASHDNVVEGLVTWLVFDSKLTAISVSERSKMLLARIVADNYEDVVPILISEESTGTLALEVGMFLCALRSPCLVAFKDIAQKEALSDNYLHRIYAKRILGRLGERVPIPPHRTLPATYSLYFPDNDTIANARTTERLKLLSNLPPMPNYRLGVASHIISHLSEMSGYSERTIEVRAGELLREKGVQPLYYEPEGDYHLKEINLRCISRRPLVQEALDAVMEVTTELIDGGAVTDDLREDWFMSYDFGDILIEECQRPASVSPIMSDDIRAAIPENWVLSAQASPRLSETLNTVDKYFVIAEHTVLAVPTEKDVTETFMSKVSLLGMESALEDGKRPFFYVGSAFQHPMEDYLLAGTGNPHFIICRGGYYSSASIRKHWLAINPSCALFLGWKPSPQGLFAWVDESGNKMVETIYWQSGNPSFKYRFEYETGEGWLVLASPEALVQLKSIGQLYQHKIITRNQAKPKRTKTATTTTPL